MRMSCVCRLLLVTGALLTVAAPAAAQRARLKPYHMLLPSDDAVRPTSNVRAQTASAPYYGKNSPRYTTFEWHIYPTDHFEIYFYPEIEHHLERVVSYAESAYQHISGELKHDLASRVPLMLYKTQSEFQQQHIIGMELPEGVLAFAEPERNRMVLPIDEAPDQLYSLIVHELTHIFEFDIIPRGLVGSGLPLWVDEGLADYMTGSWNVMDLMAVRDTAITDMVPSMSRLESAPLSGRTPYSLGHAAFEFIEQRWGKDGLRQFLFSLRKSVLGAGDTAYEEALKVTPEEFDEQFDRYLKERFRPFRDKERPADYGRNLAPDPGSTPYVAVLSLEPSPTGELLAAVVGNARDQELDIVLISSRDGQVIRNVTKGFDYDRGFEYIATAGGLRGNYVPWMGWAPVGDRLAYFVRTEKHKTLIIHNVISDRIERRFELPEVDAPESPAFSPDGRFVSFAAITAGVTDIFTLDVETGAVTNITKDPVADYAPAFSLDGRTIVYTARVGANHKLFQIDLASGARKQLTFGAHDDAAAKFYNDRMLVFSSTAVDPSVTISAEVARNGNIPNVWTLDLTTGELIQWTDTATGNVSPVVMRQDGGLRVAFISYYKGQNSIHSIAGERPLATVASADFGSPGPVLDFTAPLSHTLLRDNIRKKGAFEKMSLAGRPPVAVGVTSSGNFYGNTEVTFTDVLGDKEINFYAQSVSQYRTTAFTYVNTERRLQYALQGFFQDTFYYGQAIESSGALNNPSVAPLITRDMAESIQSQRGGTAFFIYPFNRYARAEISTGYMHLNERYVNASVNELVEEYQINQFGQPVNRNGHMIPFGFTFIKETTAFREYGPLSGSTVKLTYSGSPPLGDSWISRNTLDADARYYIRLGTNGVFAMRLRGLTSWGNSPDFLSFGGNSEMRGYEYLEFIGQRAFFANAELRFPFIEAMLTPIGVLGGLRGVLYANLGGAAYGGQPFKVFASAPANIPVVTAVQFNPNGEVVNTQTQIIRVDGIRLQDARASYGFGLQSSLLGFPMHFDWTWRTLLDRDYEDTIFRACAPSPASPLTVECFPAGGLFRDLKFDFWIGYDF